MCVYAYTPSLCLQSFTTGEHYCKHHCTLPFGLEVITKTIYNMPQYGEEVMLIFKMAPRITDDCSRATEPRSIPSSMPWPFPYEEKKKLLQRPLKSAGISKWGIKRDENTYWIETKCVFPNITLKSLSKGKVNFGWI